MFRNEKASHDVMIYDMVSLSAMVTSSNRLFVQNCVVSRPRGKPHILVNLGVSCLSDDTKDPPRLWFRLLDLALYLSQRRSGFGSESQTPFFLEYFSKNEEIE